MFKQFGIARFVVCFIVFILAYVVARDTYDSFFQLITGGMFVLTIYIMNEIRKGHHEELLKKDQECAERIAELEDQLHEKDAQLQQIIQAITINRSSE